MTPLSILVLSLLIGSDREPPGMATRLWSWSNYRQPWTSDEHRKFLISFTDVASSLPSESIGVFQIRRKSVPATQTLAVIENQLVWVKDVIEPMPNAVRGTINEIMLLMTGVRLTKGELDIPAISPTPEDDHFTKIEPIETSDPPEKFTEAFVHWFRQSRGYGNLVLKTLEWGDVEPLRPNIIREIIANSITADGLDLIASNRGRFRKYHKLPAVFKRTPRQRWLEENRIYLTMADIKFLATNAAIVGGCIAILKSLHHLKP